MNIMPLTPGIDSAINSLIDLLLGSLCAAGAAKEALLFMYIVVGA